MELKGHAAIVTGGASGLGAETARYLAKGGAKVAVVDPPQFKTGDLIYPYAEAVK